MPRPRRTRRDPEASRAHILASATTVLARLGPDKAGLKDVAAAAGVSHGLITHYFGTFDALVEQVLQARMQGLRDELIAAVRLDGTLEVEPLVQAALDQFLVPETGRLLAWAFLSGRMDRDDFHARQSQGMMLLADAVTSATGAPRDTVEETLVIVWSAIASYAVAREVLWASLGHTHRPEHDARVAKALASVVQQTLEE